MSVKNGIMSGLLYGITQFNLAVVFSLIMFLGAVIIRDNYPNLSVEDALNAIYALVIGAIITGNNAYLLPDIAAAKTAAANLFEIIDG